jgi:hypothetical protein
MRTHFAGLLLLFAAPVFAQTWLYQATPAIALNVGDKFADRAQSVEFTVTRPDGSTTRATALPQGGGDRSGTVHYPSDFGNAGTPVGNYKWVARVDDKAVLTGSFAYRPARNGQMLFVPERGARAVD